MCQCVAARATAPSRSRASSTTWIRAPAFRRSVPARSGATRTLTHDVLAFSVELDQPIDFDAGQFMTMQVPGVPGFRGYSMVNFERAGASSSSSSRRSLNGSSPEN